MDTILNNMIREAPVMQELWGMRSTPLLPLFAGSLWSGVVVSDRVLSMDQIERNCVLMLSWILWKKLFIWIKMDLALNNLQWLIYHKTKLNQTHRIGQQVDFMPCQTLSGYSMPKYVFIVYASSFDSKSLFFVKNNNSTQYCFIVCISRPLYYDHRIIKNLNSF